MSPHIIATLPPTATVVTDLPDYEPHDPFAAVADAADAIMLEVLMEDTDGFVFDDGDTVGPWVEDTFDSELAIDDNGDLVYRDELAGWVGL
jgi:hypothetical protein